MITCTRRLQFCAGHRVHNHESKCRNLHGHNYVALFTASAPLDDLGRVIDFSVLKQQIGGWIDEHWDHGFILWDNDLEARATMALMPQQKLFLLPTNPTAENMARHLLQVVCPERLAGTGVEVIKVRLWETENCYAEAALG